VTYLVTDNCVKCKHTDCVEVCPVDCFYEGENFLAINPDECIDCGVCEPECPADAIVPDNALEGSELDKWMDINRKYSLIWPVLTEKKDPMPDWKEYDGVENKYEAYFSEKPGEGDD
jgi:ferredoxin